MQAYSNPKRESDPYSLPDVEVFYMHSGDVDAVKAFMGFLTLRKGDTDAEYFDSYTAVQTEFSETHAESLAMEVYSRFGE